MSKAGQSVFRGLNYQSMSALLLFLLKLDDSNFESVTLEDDKWEDFTLNFSSGKKIVCESKNYKSPLSRANIESILSSIQSRDREIAHQDEIWIICPQVESGLIEAINASKFYSIPGSNPLAANFTEEQIKLLERTTFQLFPGEAFLEEELETYFPSHLGYWLPDTEIKALLSKVLIEHVYLKSSKGAIFSRVDLSNVISSYIADKVSMNSDYDVEKTAIRVQYSAVLEKIRWRDHKHLIQELTLLSSRPTLMLITLDTISELEDLNLREWNYMYSRLIGRQYAFPIIRSFARSLDSLENSKYVVEFLTEHVASITSQISDRYLKSYVLEMIAELIEKHPSLASDVLTFISVFLENRGREFFDLATSDKNYIEKSAISKLLLRLFLTLGKTKHSAKQIVILAAKHFSLTQDDGDHLIYTPASIFDLVKQYLVQDFAGNFEHLLSLLVADFKQTKFYSGAFSGWEIYGGSVSGLGNQYSLADRYFISAVLRPAARQYLDEGGEEAWNFLKSRFVARNIDEVCEAKPDFLGRAIVPLLLERYPVSEDADEIMGILKDQVLMEQGIPGKHEVIFQELNIQGQFPLDAKWELARTFITRYPTYQSPFLEQLVMTLCMNDHVESLEALGRWVADPAYKGIRIGKTLFTSEGVLKLLTLPSETKAYKKGFEMIRTYLGSDEFLNDKDTRDLVEISQNIAKILSEDFDTGLAILQEMVKVSRELSSSEQLFVGHVLESVPKEDPGLLLRIFREFVQPLFLVDLGANTIQIQTRFPEAYARQLVVQFAEHLASAKLFEEALSLAYLFVGDSDPSVENSPDDPDGMWNYHSRILAGEDTPIITTVRGHVAWLLNAFCVADAQSHLLTAYELTSNLTRDPNLYVRVQSTFPLTSLAANRHTYLPGTNRSQRFMTVELARKIEMLAFEMLTDDINRENDVVLEHLLKVFSQLRTLNEDEAKCVLDSFVGLSARDSRPGVSALIVYYAHFRQSAFSNSKYQELFGPTLFTELNSFNPHDFVNLLMESIIEGTENLRAGIAWQLWQLPKSENQDFEEMFALSLRYFKVLAQKYSHDAYSSLQYFLKDFIDIKTNECLTLWKECSEIERDFLNANVDTITPGGWWPFHENADFMNRLLALERKDDYCQMLMIFLGFPKRFEIGIDPITCLATLKEMGSHQTELIESLCERFEWLYAKDA